MLAACLLALLGFAFLALSQERHLERVFESNRPLALTQLAQLAQLAQRATGFIAIGLALPLCIVGEGAGFGCLLWVMLTVAAAMVTALTLTWRPNCLRPLARAAHLLFSFRPSQLP